MIRQHSELDTIEVEIEPIICPNYGDSLSTLLLHFAYPFVHSKRAVWSACLLAARLKVIVVYI